MAELFAWQQLASRFGQTLAVAIQDREGRRLYEYEPLRSPAVQRRFAHVEALLAEQELQCPAEAPATPPDRPNSRSGFGLRM
ncbi:MAG TPA: hypothetical protein VKY80_07940 [Croceibacterium sp.]|nr:hypothetical protein [Croceibacterium sp.]